MSRYINEEAAKKVLLDERVADNDRNYESAWECNMFLEAAVEGLNDLPADDVVELVRCKDCKHNPQDSTDDDCPFVEESGCYVKYFPEDDGFCQWGEKKEK